MRARIMRYFALLVVVALILYWNSLTPSITAEDIVIRGVIRATKDSPGAIEAYEAPYVIEIFFDNISDKTLYFSDRKYFYDVYPYIPGYVNAFSDYYLGLDNSGQVIPEDGYNIGSNGRTIKIAQVKLQKENIITNELPDYQKGFSYTGSTFPQKLRMYLMPVENTFSQDEGFLIYAHYEKRFGKDLSWAKITQVEIIR